MPDTGLISRFGERHKTAVLTVAVIITNVVGNLMLSRGMQHIGASFSAAPLAYVRGVLSPWTLAGVVILCSWMVLDLALLSRADLTFVLPMTASAYVLIAIAGHVFFREQAGLTRWIAIGLITAGAALAGETPPKTTEAPPEEIL